MDITLCVMMPPRGATDWSVSAHAKHPVLNIICVFPLQTIPEVSAPRTGYIHITGIPDGFATIGQLQLWLSEGIEDENGNLVAKRAWTADPNDLPTPRRNELLANRQVTLTWRQARAAWKRSDTGGTLQQRLGL